MATSTGLEPAKNLRRDRAAFYTIELRCHVGLIDFSLNLYVYIISEISIKIKLFLSKFSFSWKRQDLIGSLAPREVSIVHLLGEFEPFP